MAELIMTEEERKTALWTDLDDASLGRVLKRSIATLEGHGKLPSRKATINGVTGTALDLEQLQITLHAAALILITQTDKFGNDDVEMTITGVTRKDVSIGNWRLKVWRED